MTEILEKRITELFLGFSNNISETITSLYMLAGRLETLRKESCFIDNFEIIAEKNLIKYVLVHNSIPETIPSGEIMITPELRKKLARPISSLDLSKRIKNFIENHGTLPGQIKIKVIGDLVKESETYLLKNIKGFGPDTLQKTKEALSKIGLQFGMNIYPK